MKREINNFWTYDEVLVFFNYIFSDLTYAELNLLVRLLQNKLIFKKYEKRKES